MFDFRFAGTGHNLVMFCFSFLSKPGYVFSPVAIVITESYCKYEEKDA